MPVTLLVIACPKTSQRLVYLDRTLKSLRARMKPDVIDRWVVSTETTNVQPNRLAGLKLIASDHGFQVIEHPRPAGLGRHMNWLIQSQLRGLFFCAQDDIVLFEPLDLTPAIRLIEEGAGKYVRYLVHEKPTMVDSEKYLGFSEMVAPEHPYGDPQFLAHTNFFKTIGPFIERGGHEREMSDRVKASGMPVWVSRQRPFAHIGADSVLGHNCPYVKLEDVRFKDPPAS